MLKKKWMIGIVLALVFTLAFSTVAWAQTETPEVPAGQDVAGEADFYMEVAHMIQGNQIGLSKETPLILHILRNGVIVDYAYMMYGDRIGVVEFAGDFSFNFINVETGETLVQCGPFSLGEELSQVRLQVHEKGIGRIPACYVKQFE